MSKLAICHTLTRDSQAKEGTVAQQVVTSFEDDLTGGEAEGTVRFSLDGADWEIDLNAENAAALRKVFVPYVDKARKASGTQTPRRTRPAHDRQRTPEIRTWAKQRGYELNERGRIPANIVADFEAAQG
jgi:hypothetical protein